jgi:hypothetical protein
VAFFYLLLLLLLIIGVVGAVLYIFTDMTQRVKHIIFFSLVLGWILIAIYSYYQNKKRVYLDMLYYNYIHGKELQCFTPFDERVAVDKKRFDFISGTLVFIGKEGSKLEGLIVPLENCKLKGE